MVIAGREVTEEQVGERIAYLRFRMMLADQHCDDETKARIKAELDWLSAEAIR